MKWVRLQEGGYTGGGSGCGGEMVAKKEKQNVNELKASCIEGILYASTDLKCPETHRNGSNFVQKLCNSSGNVVWASLLGIYGLLCKIITTNV